MITEQEVVKMGFEDKLASWLCGAQEIVSRNNEQFPNLKQPVLSLERGRRYIRVVWERPGDVYSRRVHCFIDKNGDVLMSASWRAPAKTARGNIFNPDNGLDCMGPYGAAYLK